MRRLPDIDHLRSLLNYDPKTGEMTWIVDRGTNKTAGRKTGLSTHNGYLRLRFNGQNLRVSRVAWALHYGEDPYPFTIDHINRQKDDNRIENLRKADRKMQDENKSHSGGKTQKKSVRIVFPDSRGVVEVESVAAAAKLLDLKPSRVSVNLTTNCGQLCVGPGRRNPTGIRLEWV